MEAEKKEEGLSLWSRKAGSANVVQEKTVYSYISDTAPTNETSVNQGNATGSRQNGNGSVVRLELPTVIQVIHVPPLPRVRRIRQMMQCGVIWGRFDWEDLSRDMGAGGACGILSGRGERGKDQSNSSSGISASIALGRKGGVSQRCLAIRLSSRVLARALWSAWGVESGD